jgi:DNA-binding response OmpR family regulator
MPQRKVLVADDSRNIVNLIKYNFEKKGYSVIEAYDGEDSLKKAFSEKPDLIILDINMPVKDGFEVCRTLRNTPQTLNVPIIILSARSKEFDKLTGFGLGADDYITKPFKIEELVERADSLLTGRKGGAVQQIMLRRPEEETGSESHVHLGVPPLDDLFKNKLFKGANILLTGTLGTGKSTICRKFMAEGLQKAESGLYISVEDPPGLVSESLNNLAGYMLEKYKNDNKFRLVSVPEKKPASIDELLNIVTGAGDEVEQNIQKKKGGRRVMDSVSGLFLNYDEGTVNRFLAQFVHTASAFGGVTTLYTLEEGTLTTQQNSMIKSLMDGVIELKMEQTGVFASVVNMKWVDVSKDKVKIWNRV